MDDGFAASGYHGFAVGPLRVERRRAVPVVRVVVLKLDHLGDFIMGLPAMERLRAHFPHALLTLVCGAWNMAAARGLGLFDRLVAFDAFPADGQHDDWPRRDVLVGRLLERLDETFDLAIDLRVDEDTRPYLLAVSSRVRAGIGTRSRFAFLDVFLPVDATRAQPPPPRVLPAHLFRHNPPCTDQGYAIGLAGPVTQPCVLVFGPYAQLPLGRYRFRPFLEMAAGQVSLEVVIDDAVVLRASARPGAVLRFFNPTPSGHLQVRVLGAPDGPAGGFRFFGGALERDDVSDGLHQSEYLVLLVELVALRVKGGLLTEDAACRA